MKAKLRKITVDGVAYKWHCSAPEEDYGMRKLRAWLATDSVPLLEEWIHPRAQKIITPKFVAAQIGFATKPLDFYRAAGACLCEQCGEEYRKHPNDGPFFEGYQWLHRLCNGDLVKL